MDLAQNSSVKASTQGLLSTAEKIRCTYFSPQTQNTQTYEYPFLQLHNMLNSFGILHFALYVPFNRRYEMVFNHGFDFASMTNGSSSVDFWEGTLDTDIEPNTWYTQSDTALYSFLQLFSKDDREHISMLHIKFYSFSNSPNCILLVSQQNTSITITDHLLDAIDDNFDDIFPLLDRIIGAYTAIRIKNSELLPLPEDVIQTNCMNGLIGTMVTLSLSAFFERLTIHTSRADCAIISLFFLDLLKEKIGEPNICVKGTGDTVKIILFSLQEKLIESYEKEISSFVAPFFDKKTASKLTFTFGGYSEDSDELIDFITDKAQN